MHINRMLYHCTSLQNTVIIIFDTQKRNFKHEKWWIHSVAILRLSQHHQGFCAARLHTPTVGNVKIARSERSYYCYIHTPTFRIVLLLRNFEFWWQIVSVWSQKYCICISSPSLAIAGEHRKRHIMHLHKQEAVSDWLNPHSLGTMSAFGCIDNLAQSSTCLINYQDITRSI